MNTLSILQSRSGRTTRFGYDFESGLHDLVQRGDVDCSIQSAEMGFSPLGASRDFLGDALGVYHRTLNMLANSVQRSDQVSLIGVPARNPTSAFRGLVLAAGQSARSYQQFGAVVYGQPYRDFFYNVAYESIAYAAKTLGARKLCMSHLSISGRFNGTMATCIAEALAHYCDDDANPPIESFMFFGCCITGDHLHAIEQLNKEGEQTQHRPIRTWTSAVDGYEVLNLDWR